MSRHRLIVLKFGGSVLRDAATLRIAVHEIYRWRRGGWRVIAVVSALADRTDELLHTATDRSDAPVRHFDVGSSTFDVRRSPPTPEVEGPDPHATAALVATGELHSAGLLGIHLDRAGIRAAVLWPMSFDLVAQGPPLNADPVSLNRAPLERALARHGIVIVPGYAAHDADGRPVVLGRGGSDLTALFLACELSADKCRLIKDVDGLYDRDPSPAVPLAARPPVRASTDSDTGRQAASGTTAAPPRRYAAATFADALATDGSIIQHKAVRFAQGSGLCFEVGRHNGTRPTLVGAPRTRFCAPDLPRRLRVALLGLGTVGGGVYELLRQMPEQFEVSAIAVRNPSRLRPPGATASPAGEAVPRHAHQRTASPSGEAVAPGVPLLTHDALAAAASGADIVVEAIGGCDAALAAVRAALQAGAHLVSANKSLIAAHGCELAQLARANGVSLRYSAAVGGCMPLLERAAAAPAGHIRSIRGVINGTTNFILDSVSDGMTFADAVRLAQRHGYAEQDPTQDLAGIDAAEKLCVLAWHIGAGPLSGQEIGRDVLCEARLAAALAGRRASGGPLRHVAMLTLGPGGPRGEVRLLQVGPGDPLARASGAGNVAVIEHAGDRRETVEGKGAGRWPTAEAVVADLLEIARARKAAGKSGRADGRFDDLPAAEPARPRGEGGRERAYTPVLRV